MDFIADSLAVDYLWIAVVVTAAATFSFWKFRNSSPCSFEPIQDSASEERRAQTVETPSSSSAAVEASPVLALPTTAMAFGTTKGKMTLFFGECRKEEVEMKDGGGKDGGGDDGDGAAGEGWWSAWERAVRVRRGEAEWYSFQDVKFINGNVVRLWDDVRTRLLPLSYVVC